MSVRCGRRQKACCKSVDQSVACVVAHGGDALPVSGFCCFSVWLLSLLMLLLTQGDIIDYPSNY